MVRGDTGVEGRGSVAGAVCGSALGASAGQPAEVSVPAAEGDTLSRALNDRPTVSAGRAATCARGTVGVRAAEVAPGGGG